MNPTAAAPGRRESFSDHFALLVEELTARLQAGEALDVEAFLQAHPADAEQLRRLLPALLLLAEVSGPGGGPAPATAPGDELGELGDFRLIREVGRGGMGIVYEAEQVSLGRRVALKVLPFAATLDPRQLQRFHNEARAAACLHHEHIIPVYSVGCERSVHFYAMQFIDGQTLAQLIHALRSAESQAQADAPTAPDDHPAGGAATAPVAALSTERPGARGRAYYRRAAELIAQAAEALEHAHSLGIVHRDIKPANLLVGPGDKLWVGDFGLARLGADVGLTLSGDLLGTLRYMAPEQALARHGLVDHRADVYALGATLYELLTLQPAFPGNDRQELLRQIAFEEPRPPRQLDKGVPAELETIVLKALEKSPAERYATAQELADDLRRFLDNRPIRARPAGLVRRCTKWVWRRPALAAAYGLAVMVLLLSGLGSGAAWLWRRAETALGQAEVARGDADLARAGAEQALQMEQQARAGEAEAQRRAVVTSNLLRVNMAERAWLDKDPLRAGNLLESCPPELRQWEWHHVNGLCHPELRTVRVDRGPWVFSPDGKLLATGLNQRDVRVWDLAKGKETLTLKGLTNPILCLAFSADGKRLAAGGGGGPRDERPDALRYFHSGEVRIWDLATGKGLCTFRGHSGEVWSVALSPDGRLAASGSDDRTIKVWDAVTGQEVRTLTGHTRRVRSVAFSPDGKRLASAGEDKTVKVWDAATGQETLTLKGHTGGFSSLAFSPDSKQLACGAPAGKDVQVIDLTTGEALHLEHTSGVTGAAFSPDGRRLVTLSGTLVKVWHLGVNRKALALGGFSWLPVLWVAFSPDGKRLACASSGSVPSPAPYRLTYSPAGRVFDPTTGEEMPHLQGLRATLLCIAYSPDGQRLAGAARDKTVRVWDSATGKEVITLPGQQEVVYSVAFSPDGKRLATASNGKTGKVWDLATGQEVCTLRGHTGPVTCVASSPDGKHLATSSLDRTVRVWDVASGREVLKLTGHGADVSSVAFSPDGKRLVSASYDRTVKVWDRATGKEVLSLRGHTGGVHGVAFSPDGRRLATASVDQTVRVWDAATGRETILLRHADKVLSVAFSPDGRHLASSGAEREVRVWDLATTENADTLQGHLGNVMSVVFSRDGRRLASVSVDGAVKGWDMSRAATPQTLTGIPEWANGGALSPDGRSLAIAPGFAPTVRVWDLATKQETINFNGHTDGVMGVAFSPNGKLLASASADKTVKIWDLATRKEFATLSGHAGLVWCVAYSPDGKRLASGSTDQTVKVWDAATHKLTRTLDGRGGQITSVAFSPDGKYLANGSISDKAVKVWDLESGQVVRILPGHSNWVKYVAFSPDGKHLASASADWTIKLWDTATGKEIHTLKGHLGQVDCVAFSPDGRRLASGSGETVKLWDLATGEEALTPGLPRCQGGRSVSSLWVETWPPFR